MNRVVSEIAEFLNTSEFWNESLARFDDPDVTFHESRFETGLDPTALEYLFRELLRRRGADIRNVGHAAHKELAWIKFYSVGSPVFNVVWHHQPGTILAPYEPEPFATWRHSDIAGYLDTFAPRLPGPQDVQAVTAYLESDHWHQEMLDKIEDPDIEHFHLYLETDLDPRVVEVFIREALRQAGVTSNVPPFFLANPGHERPGMWVGQAPDGRTSWEVVLYHVPGSTLRAATIGEEERAYGGDGWTIEHYKSHVDRYEWNRLTLNEAEAVLERVPADGLSRAFSARHRAATG
jgi:hypothetical protein